MNNDGFLLKVDKMLGSSKDKGSITITMKRSKTIFLNEVVDIDLTGENWKPGTSQQRKIIEQEKNNLLTDPQKTFPVLFHSKIDKEKCSTEVTRFIFLMK